MPHHQLTHFQYQHAVLRFTHFIPVTYTPTMNEAISIAVRGAGIITPNGHMLFVAFQDDIFDAQHAVLFLVQVSMFCN